MRNRVSRCFALVTVVIYPLDHAFTVKYSDHVWHRPRDLSYYSLLNHFIVRQSWHKRRGVKALHFRAVISPNMHKSLEENTNKQTLWSTVRREHWTARSCVTDFAAGEAQHNVQEMDTLLTLQTSHLSSVILDLTAASATDTVRRHLVTRLKKYGVLSRPGYLSRCMHSNNSNNMYSPNSVFLSVEENQKRSVIEDKWRLERT